MSEPHVRPYSKTAKECQDVMLSSVEESMKIFKSTKGPTKIIEKPKYRYKITSTGASSEKYGNCEICDKFVSDVHAMTRYRKTATGEAVEWCVFGHESCLLKRREQDDD